MESDTESDPPTSKLTPTQPQSPSVPLPSPTTPFSWLPDQDVLEWISDNGQPSSTQRASESTPTSQPLTWIPDDQLMGFLYDQEQASTSTSQSSSSRQSQNTSDQEFLDWLLGDSAQAAILEAQQAENTATTSPPQPQPKTQSAQQAQPSQIQTHGLTTQQIEEIRTAITHHSPSIYGIGSEVWTPDAVKLLVLIKFHKLLSLEQASDILNS